MTLVHKICPGVSDSRYLRQVINKNNNFQIRLKQYYDTTNKVGFYDFVLIKVELYS